MKVLKKVFNVVLYSLLSILIIFSAVTLIVTKVMHKSYVNLFGYTYFVVASGSMSGTIEVNDIVVVKIDGDFKENDIITFEDEGSFITHRVVKISGEKVITRGDVNNLDDDPITKNDIVGRVSLVVPFSLLMKILTVFIFVFILYFVLNFEKIYKKYVLKVKKKKRVEKEEEDEEEDSTPLEYTQVIRFKKDIPLLNQPTTEIEVLEFDEEKDFVNSVLRILRHKNRKLKITKEGSRKLKYIYEIAVTSMIDPKRIKTLIDNAPFEELFNYEFEDISFTKHIQNQLYVMPLYVYLKLMAYSLLYDEYGFFDAIFKMLRYRIKIDRDDKFIENAKRMDEVLVLIEKIIINVGHEEAFDLKNIVQRVKAKKKKRS